MYNNNNIELVIIYKMQKIDQKTEDAINNVKRTYIDHIISYLTTGVFSMPSGTYMQAYT